MNAAKDNFDVAKDHSGNSFVLAMTAVGAVLILVCGAIIASTAWKMPSERQMKELTRILESRGGSLALPADATEHTYRKLVLEEDGKTVRLELHDLVINRGNEDTSIIGEYSMKVDTTIIGWEPKNPQNLTDHRHLDAKDFTDAVNNVLRTYSSPHPGPEAR
jgi:hypothetical protein